jgi:signal transduction histidine kinase
MIRALVILILSALLVSGISALHAQGHAWSDFWLLGFGALVVTHLVGCVVIPLGRLARHWQLALLIAQCGLVASAQAIVNTPLVDYAYLAVVVQAIQLFGPRLWVPFAAGVWLVWSRALIMLSAGALGWLYSNLALAFPATCILVAAIVYARQQRRSELVQQRIAQLQRRYDALTQALKDASQQAVLEERRRLAQTIAGDIFASLARAERYIAEALGQAQTNFERLRTIVVQTRGSASSAVDSLRATVATLRQVAPLPSGPAADNVALTPTTDGLFSRRAQRALTWALPLSFVGLVPPLIILQHPVTPQLIVIILALCTLLLAVYTLTQRFHNPLWFQAGLASQMATVVGLALFTQTTPLLLGLLLVLWQIVTRLPALQVAALVGGVQVPLSLLFIPLNATAAERASWLLLFVVAGGAVIGLVGMARRELQRRQQAELRLQWLRDLTGELERQEAQLRGLGVTAERTRLAREFHDDLGHRLVLISVQLQLAEELVDEASEEALATLAATREQLCAAWQSVLAAADALDPLDGQALAPALEALVADYRSCASPQVTLEITGALEQLARPAACAIYRTVQEGLSNAGKHARATCVRITVRCDEAAACAEVVDDGAIELWDVDPAEVPQGFGLLGLRERASMLGGTLAAGPVPPHGFRVALSIPLAGGAP